MEQSTMIALVGILGLLVATVTCPPPPPPPGPPGPAPADSATITVIETIPQPEPADQTAQIELEFDFGDDFDEDDVIELLNEHEEIREDCDDLRGQIELALANNVSVDPIIQDDYNTCVQEIQQVRLELQAATRRLIIIQV